MKISFLLTGEGTSDLNLVDHIEKILIEEGFSEVSGEAPDLSRFRIPVGHAVRDKVGKLMQYYPHAEVIFIHRDADDAGIDAREQEIFRAVDGLGLRCPVIPLIPVRQLETWLLTDESAIKRVAGNATYRGHLPCVPVPSRLEKEKDSKTALLEALCMASEVRGPRLKKFRNRFGAMRTRLALDLDPQGPIQELPSYQYFRKAVAAFAQDRLGHPPNGV